MIKTLLTGLLLLLSLFMRADLYHVRAPELFGNGQMLIVESASGRTLGLVRAWGWYAIIGLRGPEGHIHCRLIQLTGTVHDARGIAIPCRVKIMKNGKFQGWIDFRGHTRPFCGAQRPGRFPKCKLEAGR